MPQRWDSTREPMWPRVRGPTDDAAIVSFPNRAKAHLYGQTTNAHFPMGVLREPVHTPVAPPAAAISPPTPRSWVPFDFASVGTPAVNYGNSPAKAKPVIALTRTSGFTSCGAGMNNLLLHVPGPYGPEASVGHTSPRALEKPSLPPQARADRGAARLQLLSAESPRHRPYRLPPMGVSPLQDTWRSALIVDPTVY